MANIIDKRLKLLSCFPQEFSAQLKNIHATKSNAKIDMDTALQLINNHIATFKHQLAELQNVSSSLDSDNDASIDLF